MSTHAMLSNRAARHEIKQQAWMGGPWVITERCQSGLAADARGEARAILAETEPQDRWMPSYVDLDSLHRIRLGAPKDDPDGGIAHVALAEALAAFCAEGR